MPVRAVQNGEARSQGARDEQTLNIATALAVLLAILALGGLVILAIGFMADDLSGVFHAGYLWVVGLGAVACVAYLGRHRR
jgi:fatty acid desaturase